MKISFTNLNTFNGLLIIKNNCKRPDFEVETKDIIEIDTSKHNSTTIRYNNENNELRQRTFHTLKESKRDILIGYAAAVANKDVIIKI